MFTAFIVFTLLTPMNREHVCTENNVNTPDPNGGIRQTGLV